MRLTNNELSMIRDDLDLLHEVAYATGSWGGKQGRTFTDVGEYGLALDSIAHSYLDTGRTMPPETFETFEKLATMMSLAKGPEYDGVARLRARGVGTPG